jgi:undecaprenyl-diphosphatase
VAVSIAAVIDALIVLDWKRPRPFISHSTQVLMPIISGLRVTRVSFPSVHAYVVFAIATSVYLYGHRKLGTVLYGLAILVAIGRVGAGLHYPSDVIAGALLGIGSAILAFLIVQKAEPNWR